jgi:hypothetical protein
MPSIALPRWWASRCLCVHLLYVQWCHLVQLHEQYAGPRALPWRAQGIGIEEILEAVVQRIPPPPETLEEPLRALIFDSYYDPYKATAAAVPR